MENTIDNFEQYQEHTFNQWQKSIIFTSFIVACIILFIEIYIYLSLLHHGIKEASTFTYVLIRIICPTTLNFGSLLATMLVRKNPNISRRLKIYFASLPLFIICSVLSIFHSYFQVLLVSPAFCFFVCSIFGNTNILKTNGILTIFTYIIAIICYWNDPLTGEPFYKVLTLITSTALIFCSYLFATSIVKNQAEKLEYIHQNYKSQTRLIEELKIDPLTRLYNRVALKEALTRSISLSRREDTKPYIAIVDLDNFKQINDKYGHLCGDEVLITIGNIFKRNMGSFRKAFRFGGEEFVLLFDDSFASQVTFTLESIRSDMEAQIFNFAPEQSFTLSAGIAPLKKGDDPFLWLDRADKALYYAKTNGRNQVKLADDIN